MVSSEEEVLKARHRALTRRRRRNRLQQRYPERDIAPGINFPFLQPWSDEDKYTSPPKGRPVSLREDSDDAWVTRRTQRQSPLLSGPLKSPATEEPNIFRIGNVHKYGFSSSSDDDPEEQLKLASREYKRAAAAAMAEKSPTRSMHSSPHRRSPWRDPPPSLPKGVKAVSPKWVRSTQAQHSGEKPQKSKPREPTRLGSPKDGVDPAEFSSDGSDDTVLRIQMYRPWEKWEKQAVRWASPPSKVVRESDEGHQTVSVSVSTGDVGSVDVGVGPHAEPVASASAVANVGTTATPGSIAVSSSTGPSSSQGIETQVDVEDLKKWGAEGESVSQSAQYVDAHTRSPGLSQITQTPQESRFISFVHEDSLRHSFTQMDPTMTSNASVRTVRVTHTGTDPASDGEGDLASSMYRSDSRTFGATAQLLQVADTATETVSIQMSSSPVGNGRRVKVNSAQQTMDDADASSAIRLGQSSPPVKHQGTQGTSSSELETQIGSAVAARMTQTTAELMDATTQATLCVDSPTQTRKVTDNPGRGEPRLSAEQELEMELEMIRELESELRTLSVLKRERRSRLVEGLSPEPHSSTATTFTGKGKYDIPVQASGSKTFLRTVHTMSKEEIVSELQRVLRSSEATDEQLAAIRELLIEKGKHLAESEAGSSGSRAGSRRTQSPLQTSRRARKAEKVNAWIEQLTAASTAKSSESISSASDSEGEGTTKRSVTSKLSRGAVVDITQPPADEFKGSVTQRRRAKSLVRQWKTQARAKARRREEEGQLEIAADESSADSSGVSAGEGTRKLVSRVAAKWTGKLRKLCEDPLLLGDGGVHQGPRMTNVPPLEGLEPPRVGDDHPGTNRHSQELLSRFLSSQDLLASPPSPTNGSSTLTADREIHTRKFNGPMPDQVDVSGGSTSHQVPPLTSETNGGTPVVGASPEARQEAAARRQRMLEIENRLKSSMSGNISIPPPAVTALYHSPADAAPQPHPMAQSLLKNQLQQQMGAPSVQQQIGGLQYPQSHGLQQHSQSSFEYRRSNQQDRGNPMRSQMSSGSFHVNDNRSKVTTPFGTLEVQNVNSLPKRMISPSVSSHPTAQLSRQTTSKTHPSATDHRKGSDGRSSQVENISNNSISAAKEPQTTSHTPNPLSRRVSLDPQSSQTLNPALNGATHQSIVSQNHSMASSRLKQSKVRESNREMSSVNLVDLDYPLEETISALSKSVVDAEALDEAVHRCCMFYLSIGDPSGLDEMATIGFSMLIAWIRRFVKVNVSSVPALPAGAGRSIPSAEDPWLTRVSNLRSSLAFNLNTVRKLALDHRKSESTSFSWSDLNNILSQVALVRKQIYEFLHAVLGRHDYGLVQCWKRTRKSASKEVAYKTAKFLENQIENIEDRLNLLEGAPPKLDESALSARDLHRCFVEVAESMNARIKCVEVILLSS